MQTAFSASPMRPVTDLIQQARRGVLRRRVDEVARLIGLTDVEMARILNMSVRSLHGKAATEPLSLAASERLLLLERLIQHGLSVFDGRVELLARWLHTPLAELAYREETSETNTPAPPRPVRDMGTFTQQPDRSLRPTEFTQADTLTPPTTQSPLAVLDTVSGFSLAEDVLGRIDWGIAG